MSATPRIGGQAVIEGVMMRHQEQLAIAVRKPDMQIALHQETLTTAGEKFPLLKMPLLRGAVALVESLVVGVRALTISANAAAVEEEEELTTWQLTVTVGFALLLGVALFFFLPTIVTNFLADRISSRPIVLNLVEGLIRLFIFLAYMIGVAQLKDIQRVFAYHGAEHKSIACFEAGESLTLANARKYSTLHPRCGTSFLLLVMTISVLLFSLFAWPNLWQRLILRLVLLPLVAGIAYELIQLAGRFSFFRYLTYPGLWLQRLTTREPDDQQLEVAICAIQAVLAGVEKREVLEE
ncbi:MAG: DUF1385 domain-containing protein [Firmicutes bacterium]|nr:DUF1385 domain-containing protein [Bacillota bacterium]